MKRITFFFLCACIGNIFAQFTFVKFPIKEITKTSELSSEVIISLNGKYLPLKKSEGNAYRLYESTEPDMLGEFAIANLLKVDKKKHIAKVALSFNEENTKARIGDYVELPIEEKQNIDTESLVFLLEKEDISLTKSDESVIFKPNSTDIKDKEILKNILVDLDFTAKTLREANDAQDYAIEKGDFLGMSVFDAMMSVEEEDLLHFFSYIRQYPEKYFGHTWKATEIVATWIYAGTPYPGRRDFQIVEKNEDEHAQACEAIKIDVEEGTVAGLKLNASQAEVKETLPFYSGDTEDGSAFNCGGGVFFLSCDMFFYTGRDYVECRSNFAGKSSTPLIGLAHEEIHEKYGDPDKSLNGRHLYKRKYGTLVLEYERGMVKTFALYAAAPEDVIFCD